MRPIRGRRLVYGGRAIAGRVCDDTTKPQYADDAPVADMEGLLDSGRAKPRKGRQAARDGWIYDTPNVRGGRGATSRARLPPEGRPLRLGRGTPRVATFAQLYFGAPIAFDRYCPAGCRASCAPREIHYLDSRRRGRRCLDTSSIVGIKRHSDPLSSDRPAKPQ